MQRLTGRDLGTASMHLQRADRGHKNHAVGREAAIPALDIAEFFHADIRAESGFRQHVSIGPTSLSAI